MIDGNVLPADSQAVVGKWFPLSNTLPAAAIGTMPGSFAGNSRHITVIWKPGYTGASINGSEFSVQIGKMLQRVRVMDVQQNLAFSLHLISSEIIF